MCNLPDKPRVSFRNVSENENRGLAVRFLEEVKQEFRVTLHATLLGTPLVRDNRVRKSAHVVVVFQINGEGVFHLSLRRAKGTSRQPRSRNKTSLFGAIALPSPKTRRARSL